MNGCCGKVIKNNNFKKTKIPANPKISNGIAVIYLGSGNLKLTNNESSNVYYVSNYRRELIIDKLDQNKILKRKDFMLNPDKI